MNVTGCKCKPLPMLGLSRPLLRSSGGVKRDPAATTTARAWMKIFLLLFAIFATTPRASFCFFPATMIDNQCHLQCRLSVRESIQNGFQFDPREQNLRSSSQITSTHAEISCTERFDYICMGVLASLCVTMIYVTLWHFKGLLLEYLKHESLRSHMGMVPRKATRTDCNNIAHLDRGSD